MHRCATVAGLAWLLLFHAMGSPAAAAPPASPAAAAKPNIVFFLIDDMGWKDVGYHGGPYPTPNIDRLAREGARLEAFYAMPVCSPTRATLLTGRYPIRYGLQSGVVRPWADYGLPLEERTLGQALHEAGYFTAICGKWHLGQVSRDYLPTRRGFDHQYGHYNGAIDYFSHMREGGFDWHRNDKVCRDEGYTTHLLARETVRLIEEHGGDQPLFLYVAFNAIHTPHQVPEDYKKPYANRTNVNATIGGMMSAVDEAIGQIVGAVEKKGLTERTLFVLSSDNGGPVHGSNGDWRAGKGTLYEGGVRVAAFANWKGVIKPGLSIQEPIHMSDWYPTFIRLAGGSIEQPLPLDGKDIWPVLTEGKPTPHEELLINAEPACGAIRKGAWKLIVRAPAEPYANGAPAGKRPAMPPIELFNLQNDPGEKQNLAATETNKVRELRARYDVYAREAVPSKVSRKPKDFKAPEIWGE
jgi:arylsulfatase A-like enzyme